LTSNEPEPPTGGFELEAPRDFGGLLSESFEIYRRNFLRFFVMAACVVVPVHAAVLGFGLKQFSGGYDSAQPSAAGWVPLAVQVLVVGPLMAVIALHAVQELAGGPRRPRVGASIQAGLDAFAVVFWPVVLAVLGEIAAIVTIIGIFVLVIRWYFVPQVVVVEGARGTQALRASWEVTRGFGWRTAGFLLVGNVVYGFAGALISTPVDVLARGVDSEAVGLASTTLGETLAAAPIGIFVALVYFDLRSRQRALVRS
jgi:hypothetical protein